MAFKLNKIKTDIGSYVHYIRGVPKSGKTTLFRDLVLAVHSNPERGLLISFGDEDGYLSLDQINYEDIEFWDVTYEGYAERKLEEMVENFEEEFPDKTKKEIQELAEKRVAELIELQGEKRGFIQLVNDLVLKNGEYGIKMLCYDTIDKMIEIATKEIITISRKETGKPCKSLNAAFGGYGEGKKRLVALIQEQTRRLKEIGLYPFVLGHTKVKEKSDDFTDTEFTQLTSSLTADLDAIFGNTAQVIATISVDKIIKDNKIIGTERNIHFRDDGLVDCGARFTGMPDKVLLSAKNYIDAFNMGVKNSYLKLPEIQAKAEKEVEKQLEPKKAKAKVVDEELENAVKDHMIIVAEQAIENMPETIEDVAVLIKEIKTIMGKGLKAKTLTTKKINEILSNHSLTTPDQIETVELAKAVLKDL